MSELSKSIVQQGVSFKVGEFHNDSSMVESLPEKTKKKVLEYLKKAEPSLVGDMPLVDPITGKVYDRTNIVREKDGFVWNTSTIYMLEHYDIRLTPEFLGIFKEL